MAHPLAKYDGSKPITYVGEFYDGRAHGWGNAEDSKGNKLKLLCFKGHAVKVYLTWHNNAINVLSVTNGDTLCGPATDYYPNGGIANFMFDKSGNEIGKSTIQNENDAFY